ncbi:TPA: hypothetical protein ACQZA2_005239, partial [Escherichia coli]
RTSDSVSVQELKASFCSVKTHSTNNISADIILTRTPHITEFSSDSITAQIKKNGINIQTGRMVSQKHLIITCVFLSIRSRFGQTVIDSDAILQVRMTRKGNT